MTLVLHRPSRGPTTQWYGNRQPDGFPHAGQDYGYTDGVNIFPEAYAAADGVVLYAGDSRDLGWPNQWYLNPDFNRNDNVDQSAGNIVVLGHYGGGQTIIADTGYGHLERVMVKAGDWVTAGQQIGIVGNTGFSFGKHLHFFLMFRPYNYNTNTYGCSDPNPYFTDGGASIGPAGSITPQKEDTLSAEEVRQINDHTTATLKAIALDGISGQRERGGMADVADKVDDVHAWLRGGESGVRPAGTIPAMLAGIQGQNAGLLEALKQVTSSPGSALDLEAVKAASKAGAAEALADLEATATTTVTLSQEG